MAKKPTLPPREANPKVRYGLTSLIKQTGFGDIEVANQEMAMIAYDAGQAIIGDMFAAATEKKVRVHTAFVALLITMGDERYNPNN